MKNVLFLGTILFVISCMSAKQENESIYWINSYKVDCVGVGPMKCLLVQKSESIVSGQWKNFYSKIDGFDFEPGYLYKLKIKEEKLDNISTDASSINYSLVKVLEKNQDTKLRINDIWVATLIDGEKIKPADEAGGLNNVQIEIHIAEMRIIGNDGCNNISGSIATFDDGIIEFGPIAGTRMMCNDMTVPDKFNVALAQVKKYKIENLNLTFLDEEGKELISFKKVD